MTHSSRTCSLLCFGWLSWAACGSSEPPRGEPSPAPKAATSGDEAAVPAATSASAARDEPAPAPEPVGPAALTIDARVRGKSVPASVRVLSADGATVASGKAGDRLSFSSGEYSLQVQITEAASLLDKPTQERPLTVHAGDDLHEQVDFPWAMIQLNVVINGRAEKGASVQLTRQGEAIGMLKSGADPAPISPGHYEAQVKTKGAQVEVKGLMFPEGATQSVPVNVQL